jgi:hypothetical protein
MCINRWSEDILMSVYISVYNCIKHLTPESDITVDSLKLMLIAFGT